MTNFRKREFETGLSFTWHRDPDLTIELFWCRDRGAWLRGVGTPDQPIVRSSTPVRELPLPVDDEDAERIARRWAEVTTRGFANEVEADDTDMAPEEFDRLLDEGEPVDLLTERPKGGSQ